MIDVRCREARQVGIWYLRKFILGAFSGWQEAIDQEAIDRDALFHLANCFYRSNGQCQQLLELMHKTNHLTREELLRFHSDELVRWGVI